MTRQLYDPTEARERAQERLAAALALLEEGIAAIIDGDTFRAYLTTMSRFPTYSTRNTLLIHRQRPDAAQVAGYRTWQRLGRQVHKGETGIRIIAPCQHRRADDEGDEHGAPPTAFRVATVFALDQTDGPPLALPPPARLLAGVSDTGAWLWARLAALLAAEGIALVREDTGRANGSYSWGERRRIAVHPGLAGDQATKTLAHEVAHYVACHDGTCAATRGDKETIAEGAAYVVLHHFGLDAGAYTFPYVAGWAQDRAVLTRHLEAIGATARAIIGAVEGEAAAGDEGTIAA